MPVKDFSLEDKEKKDIFSQIEEEEDEYDEEGIFY